MKKKTRRPTVERSAARRSPAAASIDGRITLISQLDLARLGDGEVAYIRAMTSAEARRMFPSVKGLPRGIDLFALHAADGTPIALTDSRQAAEGHAHEGELEIASLH